MLKVRVLFEDDISWYVEEVDNQTDGQGNPIRYSCKKHCFKLELIEKVTYSNGDRFKARNSKDMLAQTQSGAVQLIIISGGDTGNRYTEPIKVENIYEITPAEFKHVASVPFTRYWDNRKKEYTDGREQGPLDKFKIECDSNCGGVLNVHWDEPTKKNLHFAMKKDNDYAYMSVPPKELLKNLSRMGAK